MLLSEIYNKERHYFINYEKRMKTNLKIQSSDLLSQKFTFNSQKFRFTFSELENQICLLVFFKLCYYLLRLKIFIVLYYGSKKLPFIQIKYMFTEIIIIFIYLALVKLY